MQIWVEPAAIGVTALATVILAIVTYLAVKGGDRTARAAGRTAAAARQTLDLQTRPVLVSAHRDDPPQRIVFHYGHRLRPDVAGGMAVLQDTGMSIYMGIALRNIGRGMAVLYGWHLYPGLLTSDDLPGDFGDFAGQRRALHIPPNDVGYWQAQAREKDRAVVRAADAAGKPITVDLLYGNEAGGQGQITRFHLRVLGDHRHGQGRTSRFLPRALANRLSAKGVRSCEVASRWSIDELEGNWPEQLRLEVDQAAPRPAGSGVSTAMKPTDVRDQSHKIELAMYLWEEFKYRHDLIWRLLFRVTFAAVVLTIVPFTIGDLAGSRAQSLVKLLPALAFVLVASGWWLLWVEFRLFKPINDCYVKAQNEAVPERVRPAKMFDIFKWTVYLYPGVLLILTAFVEWDVWANKIPS